MKYKGVCRTAPAAPGLLIMLRIYQYLNKSYDVYPLWNFKLTLNKAFPFKAYITNYDFLWMMLFWELCTIKLKFFLQNLLINFYIKIYFSYSYTYATVLYRHREMAGSAILIVQLVVDLCKILGCAMYIKKQFLLFFLFFAGVCALGSNSLKSQYCAMSWKELLLIKLLLFKLMLFKYYSAISGIFF